MTMPIPPGRAACAAYAVNWRLSEVLKVIVPAAPVARSCVMAVSPALKLAVQFGPRKLLAHLLVLSCRVAWKRWSMLTLPPSLAARKAAASAML